MLKVFKITLTIIVILNLSVLATFAQPSASIELVPNINCPVQGEEVAINFSFESPEESNIATFRAVICFDSSKLKYTGIYSNFGTEDFKTNLVGNTLTVIYLTSETGVYIDPRSPVNFFEVNFKVLSTAEQGTTQVNAEIDGLGNYDAVAFSNSTIKGVDLNVSTSPQADCDLRSLTAEEYDLVPRFSPNITKYSVSVPYDTSKLEIVAEPNDSDATVKVSRKTLASAGKTTDITVTVTGVDKKCKKIYTVTVKKEEKDSISTPGSSKTSSSKNSSSNKGNGLNLSNSLESASITPGVSLIKSNFNFILFFIVMATCVGIAIFVIKKNNK